MTLSATAQPRKRGQERAMRGSGLFLWMSPGLLALRDAGLVKAKAMTMTNPMPITRRAALRPAVGGVAAGAAERACLHGARMHNGKIAVGRDLLEV
jgi:hypothetical protein